MTASPGYSTHVPGYAPVDLEPSTFERHLHYQAPTASYGWNNEQLVLGVFFGRHEEVPYGLDDILDFPGLTTSMLMGIGLKNYDPRRLMMLDMADHLITLNLQVVANLLHAEGHECLCQSSCTGDSEIEMETTIETFVMEAPWHAGATKYRRIHCVMKFLQEQLQLLLIPSTDIVSIIKANEKAASAHRCINQAVQSVTHQPRVMLGQWAASILIATTSAFDMQTELRPIESGDAAETEQSLAESVTSTFSTMGCGNSRDSGSDEEVPMHQPKVIPTSGQTDLSSVARELPPSLEQPTRRSRRQESHATRPNYDTGYHHQLDDVLPGARKRKRTEQQAYWHLDPTHTQDLVIVTADEWKAATDTGSQ